MIQNQARYQRLRSILIVIIVATLPCYVLGTIVLWIGNVVKHQQTLTPTAEITATLSPWETTATSTLPPIPTSPAFNTFTPTITVSPTASPTFVIPSSTPTQSATPTVSPTVSDTPSPTVTSTTEGMENTPSP